MIRSMSSALSGLRNHQTMLDVVANDISNVSTVGFKGSTAVFSDVLTQQLSGGTQPGAGIGGTNPVQIGLGSRLVGTVQSFTQGALQRTGRSTDLAIQGDGFFIVDNGAGTLYTRAGAFTLDNAGSLTTPEGMLVQGWQADVTGAIKLLEYLVSDEAQKLYASHDFEYPVKAGAPTDPIIQSLGTLKVDSMPLADIVTHRKAASELMDKVGFDN